ncbi:MAG: hypothetical protein AB8B97_05730 [Granulosicoccus sp.]
MISDTLRRARQTSNNNRYPVLLTTSLMLCVVALSACQTSSPYTASSDVNTTSGAATGQLADLAQAPADSDASQATPVSEFVADPWITTIKADFALARYLVEKQLNIDLSSIELRLVDDSPIDAEVAYETQRLVNKQFGESDFSEQFLDQVMKPLSGTYAALYSSRLGAVMISRSMLTSYEKSLPAEHQGAVKRSALLALLVHELVHAADDLRFLIHENRELNFRASFAQSATFEGHAQWVTRQICEQADCIEGLEALDNFMFSTHLEDSQFAQPVEAVSRSVLEYSYIEGERFVAGLATRKNGRQLIENLLRSPPLDPVQILAPETYPDLDRESRNQNLIDATRNVSHPLTLAPWIGVETSPLKGIDLRADPARRKAAVDGFTRLIQGMIAMQFYDQSAPQAMPIETTVLKAESDHTARLFATMLHANTQQSGARVSDEQLDFSDQTSPTNTGLKIHLYRTAIDTDTSFRTAVAVAGQHVVQVSGNTAGQLFLDDFAIRVLLELNEKG